MQAVIIAGGQGTRLSPLTLATPKPMLPLLNQPFLAWMVERCRQAGVTDILINVHYQAHQIETFFGDGQAFGVKIRYVREETPLDTAGAMKLASPMFSGEPLVVFNADILTDLDLQLLFQVHRETQAQATLALARVENPLAFGLVELAPLSESEQGNLAPRQVLAFREKPSPEEITRLQIDTINAGTYVLEPEIFDQYTSGQPLSFERMVFPNVLTQDQRMSALVWEGYWQDLGTPAKYYQAHLDILTGQMPFEIAKVAQEQAPQVWVSPTAKVDPAAKLIGPCFIGDQVKLGANAVIPAGTVLGSHCWIDREISPGLYSPSTLAI
jgi:mannose-1-phosphate guanylyltransferase/mannose-1-phosphate guanylyltransferase/phosphomannomutase